MKSPISLANTLAQVRKHRRDAAERDYANAKSETERALQAFDSAERRAFEFNAKRLRAESSIRERIENGVLDVRLLPLCELFHRDRLLALTEASDLCKDALHEASRLEEEIQRVLHRCERRVEAADFLVDHVTKDVAANAERCEEVIAEESAKSCALYRGRG